MSTLFLTWALGVSHHSITFVLMISLRQHITAHLMFLAPSVPEIVSKFESRNHNSCQGAYAKTA
jgi:hypothetical protein